MRAINTVCRNFDFNENGNGVLELVRLNCDQCEFDDNCVIKIAYQNTKDYASSTESVVDTDESEVENE